MTADEKARIREVIPDDEAVYIVNTATPTTEVQLNSEEWQIIMQIDGQKTIREIANILSLPEDIYLPLFFELKRKRLIEEKEQAEATAEYANPDFFNKLEKILVRIIGPVATYVIEDVLTDMNESREKFLKEKIPLFTETVSQEIEDESKRVIFQQEMLQVIKTL